MKYELAFKPKLIYVFRINDKRHRGCLKIGETTIPSLKNVELQPNSQALNDAAKKRIRQYTQTASIEYDLLYTEVTVFNDKGILKSFSDSEVHKVLVRSGIEKQVFDKKNKANEWFKTDLETVKNSIKAVKEGREAIDQKEKTVDRNPVVFRPEQQAAIEKTIKQFKKSNEMLWFAKMRFGKTLSALQIINFLGFSRTLILTHRPVVDAGWFDDFGKIFYDKTNFKYGSKNKGSRFDFLEKQAKKNKAKYVYFASMQDLRGSELVGGNMNKNNRIFSTLWDFIIVDEAHEGTQTEIGKNVMGNLVKSTTKVLHLSGTPFNLLDNYKEEDIYTWDYVMEQRAKSEWDNNHFGDPNPYSYLPKLNIFTFDIGKLIKNYADEDLAFNFREFFHVNEAGKFLHLKDVSSFLNLICKEDSESNYPYSTKEYRNNFRHSLWVVPGVKEAKALSSMLQSHTVFSQFKIVNVAGDGDEEEGKEEALRKVQSAISQKPHETYTITLSCGRLTTGVSVPAWTSVFMLSGSYNTSASSYMQTIFRVQTPSTINGLVKEECFVFDFAPDRTLKVIAEIAKISSKAGKTSSGDRQVMGEFLNFCPIIAVNGSRMTTYNVENMLEHLKKVYIERVVRNGFEDGYLYNNDQLMKLTNVELKDFEKLKNIIGSTKAISKSGDIDINKQGFTDEEFAQLERIEKKNRGKNGLSEADKKLLKEKEQHRKNRESAISVLRSISIRMPLLIYGADVKDEDKQINIDNFADLIDDKSWEEFMPKGITKDVFKNFKKYYEMDVFRAAGKKIRAMTRAADNLNIEERIIKITGVFNSFRNPDKETVLTPWRVVNMHIGDCIGGYVFYDNKNEKTLEKPRFVDQGKITKHVFQNDSIILEINSKSGLYPLFMAYGIYKNIVNEKYYDKKRIPSIEEQYKIWDKVVVENIFVICKTPMARCITKRTLVGFRNSIVNTKYIEDLTNQITNKEQSFIEKVKQGKAYWKSMRGNDMKFNAIVGNPPYQEMDGGAGVSAKPIYNHFVNICKKLKPTYFSMIMPSRWFSGGKGLDSFRSEMLNDRRIRKLVDFENSNEIFPGVDVAGGICYFLWDRENTGLCETVNFSSGYGCKSERALNEFSVFIRHSKAIPIIRKVWKIENHGKTLSTVVSPLKPFGIRGHHLPSKTGIPCYFTQRQGLLFVKKIELSDNYDLLDKYKLLIPRAPIAGQTDFSKPVGFYYNGNMRIAKPGEACTETYIVAYSSKNQKDIISFKSYLLTKLFRFLLLQTVVSQDVTRDNFMFVPDLGRYQGVYSDELLCKRWGISKEEWEFIDSKIKDVSVAQ